MEPHDLEAARRPGGELYSRGRFLLVSAALILLAHLFDVVQARGPNWPALAVRLGWAALLCANARVTFRARLGAVRLVTVSANLATALIYVALLAATGRSASPLFPYSYVLVIVLPLVLPEFLALALCSSGLLSAGTLALLLHDGAGRDALLAWIHTSALALMTGAIVGRAHLETQRARRRQAEARQAALGQAAEDERMAALGRLARQVAHDVNSPLAVAHSTAVFIRQAPQGDPELPPAWTDLLAALDRIALSVRVLQQETAARPTTPA